MNHLLVVGFYLVNLGFVALYLSGDEDIATTREVFEALSTKLGVVLLVLGVMHLGNVYVLNKIRRRGVMEREQQPPVPPQGVGPPGGRGVTAVGAPRGWPRTGTPGGRPGPPADGAVRRRVPALHVPAELAGEAAPVGAAGPGARGTLRARALFPRPRPRRHPQRHHRHRGRRADLPRRRRLDRLHVGPARPPRPRPTGWSHARRDEDRQAGGAGRRQVPGAHPGPAGRGGAYRRADGWTYDPKDWLVYEAYGYGDEPPACDSSCRPGD